MNTNYTHTPDIIDARYSIKATKEDMSHAEFEARFVYHKGYESFYKGEEIWKWFEGE